MKSILHFSVVVGSLVFSSLAANAIPSRLSDCHLRGWETLRIADATSLKLHQRGENCVARFQISPDTKIINDGSRAEIEDPLRLPVGSSATYEFATMIPSALDRPNLPNLVLAQWHDNKKRGIPAERPPFSIRLRDGNIVMPMFNHQVLERQGLNGSGKMLYVERAQFDRWIQWKVRVFWAKDNRGYIEVIKDGQQVAYFRGEVGYPDDITAPYFKLGIYTTEKFDRKLYVEHTNFTRRYSKPMTESERRSGR